ncbi:hypothetical protein BH10PLA1_BH10PLA1_00310 [soil metagenome]
MLPLMYRLTAVIFILLLTAASALALEPSEILLVVNGNSITSTQWAEYYAKQRGVPITNVVQLDLPAQEEISRDKYVHDVAMPVREWLEKNDPQHKIKCLLTFIGVPIRVANRPTTPEQIKELAVVTAEKKAIEPKILPRVLDIEQLLSKLDPKYKPPTELTVPAALTIRVDRAVEHLIRRLNAEPSEDVRRAALERLFVNMDVLTGPSGRLQRVMFKDLPLPSSRPTTAPTSEPTTGPISGPTAASAINPSSAPTSSAASQATTSAADPRLTITPARREMLLQTQAHMNETAAAVQELSKNQTNPAAREQLRNIVRDELGLMTYDRLLTQQEEQLISNETGAALDNELALVLWGDDYSLYRWIENPLYFRNARRMANAPPVMMVMRLDGPEDRTVRDIIVSSLQTEKVGLGGKVVIDSQGLEAKNADGSPHAYGEYDQTLRNLNKLLKEKTTLDVVFDDQKPVLRAGSVHDVGVYVGWYAVRNYIASCSFRPGAVGFHIASLEMISLKSAGERGWVVGLLNDGIAATLGAVAEPYLHSFPRADEFFPLLFTGKLTLAEVYWRTNPLVSWQISMIGDPLYTPFKVNPALKEEDLPVDLRAALRSDPKKH